MIVRLIIKCVGTAIALVSLGVTIPGHAAADATDDAFSRKLFDDGINFGGRSVRSIGAKETCAHFDAGMSPAEVHDAILNGTLQHEGSAFSPRQTAIFIADAVQFYCPEYASQFII
ncbi:DUF732 domain-containing protein [Mycolicibacterium novocastrense]|nr:DUF732 domain-containing protein [Mycolicibacterium novocastrense]